MDTNIWCCSRAGALDCSSYPVWWLPLHFDRDDSFSSILNPFQGRVSGVKMGPQAAFASHFQPKMPSASTPHLDLPHEISPFLSLSHPLSDKYSPLVSLRRLTSPRSDAPGALSGQVHSEWEILTMMMLLNYAILLPPPPVSAASQGLSLVSLALRPLSSGPPRISLWGIHFLECRDF